MTAIKTQLFLFLPLFFTFSLTAVASTPSKHIKAVECTANGIRVIFSNDSKKSFSAPTGHKCNDFKISADRQYVGWKFEGELIVKTDDKKQNFPDATLYVLIDEKSYAVTENTRFVNNWYFVPGNTQVVAETSFLHGPSKYWLYDLKKRNNIEVCDQLELSQCPRLKKFIKE